MTVVSRIATYCRAVFSLDYRSLAVFRIAVGLILLADVILRWPMVPHMYTDAGVLPRPMMRQVWQAFDAVGLQQWGEGTWSLYALSGEAWWAYALLAIAGILAVMLAAGWQTRWVTIASFVWLVSAHNRIPFVLTSGDTHLRIVMFWAMFLPLNQIWSLDSRRRNRNASNRGGIDYCSPATAGLVVQMFILYFFSGLAKWNDAWWSGEGIFLAANLTIYDTAFSQSFLEYPTFCRIASIATLVTEVFFPWLLFVPLKNAWFRMLNLVTFVTMHVGIVFLLSIGLFPYICIAIWAALLPTEFWNVVEKMAGRVPLLGGHDSPRPSSWGLVGNSFVALMIPFVLAWNVINVFPSWMAKPQFDPSPPHTLVGFDESENVVYRAYEVTGHALGIGQHFQMFGLPPVEDCWFVYRATLHNGQVKDIFLGGRDWREGKPLSGRDALPHHHWRQLHRNLTDTTCYFVRQRMAEYMVEQWNRNHAAEEQVANMRLEAYFDQFWPTTIPGEVRGALIWGTYPDGPANAFDSLLQRALQGTEARGF